MKTFDFLKDRFTSAKKKLFPLNLWGCVGQMTMAQFKGIIIAQWVILVQNSLSADFYTLPILSVSLGSVVIGFIASGFGTSIYTTHNQATPETSVKRAMFNITELIFILALIFNIVLDFAIINFDISATLETVDLFSVRTVHLVFNVALFFLALVTLIIQTCCFWNQIDREWIFNNLAEAQTVAEENKAEENAEAKEEEV
ncbi:Oidioi.mRNA.OKI2018_I69.chr1.g871.t1.cds [Oikopleura dioica]|uniref:Oidioi.mRNA.OKI2018_I69.chr1.g871.t1.cds n=1 Tax=Oikopleura dioica TaxID=34765 RepID=A0ABN7SL86_OIKDI|nr:Oidioi.mRNA.OKI2018_I69.chr1.g871.t1.cds [Oikopleura dioica]